MSNKQTLAALRAAKTVAREVYAWPGGYPLMLVMTDGECLCPACCKSQYREIVRAALDCDRRSGWMPAAATIHYEGPDETCAHCNAAIPSAYGDPEEGDAS